MKKRWVRLDRLQKLQVKQARTTKEFTTTLHGREVTVPVGSLVSNQTACGPDDEYRFWSDWAKTIDRNSILGHDLTYYGVNVPADHCTPWGES